MNKKGFSYYDIEQFLRDAGARRINEDAIVSFEKELENTVKDLVNEAEMYANYAGRNKLITNLDIDIAETCPSKRVYLHKNSNHTSIKKSRSKKIRINNENNK